MSREAGRAGSNTRGGSRTRPMATSSTARAALNKSPDEVRSDWLHRLSGLVGDVEAWARALDWSTRRIEKKLEDSELGKYLAPALLLQKETVRIILEPIGRSAPGAEGRAD